MLCYSLPDPLCNLFGRAVAIDDTESAGVMPGKGEIRFPHFPVKFERLLIHARFFRREQRSVPGVCAAERGVDINIDQQRQIRRQPAAGDAIECEDGLFTQTAAVSLICERRICEPVAKDDLTR